MKILLLTTFMIFQTTNAFARPDRDRTPPASAISACEGQEEGASCTVEGRNGKEVAGQCTTSPDKKYFACKPERRGRGQ